MSVVIGGGVVLTACATVAVAIATFIGNRNQATAEKVHRIAIKIYKRLHLM